MVQSFLGEVPFFLCSEWIVRKIGFDHSLSVTFLSIAIRYLSYGFLIKGGHAYYVLIVELLQGPSYSLFYVVMTALAQSYSLKAAAGRRRQALDEAATRDTCHHTPSATACKGADADSDADAEWSRAAAAARDDGDEGEATHATMQGLMSAAFEGAGLGVGALIAGLSIDRFGSESTWILAGFLALAVCTSNLLLTLNLEKCSRSQTTALS